MADVHFATAFTRARGGELQVRFKALCGQTLRDPDRVTGDTSAATCRACCREIGATITDATLRALIAGAVPPRAAGGAWKVEDEWALCRKGGDPLAGHVFYLWP